MKCRVCGNEVAPGKKYCDKCGTGLGNAATAKPSSQDNNIAWNTRDFPKPKQPKEIKMQWNKPAMPKAQPAPVAMPQPAPQPAPQQPSSMPTWQMPTQQQVNIPPAYNVQPHNIQIQPAPQPAPFVVPQSAYQQQTPQQPVYANLQNTNPNLQPLGPVYQQPAVQPAPQPAPIFQQPAPVVQSASQQPVYANLQNTNPNLQPVAPVYQQPAFQQPQQPVYANLQNTNPNLQPVAPVYQQPAAQPAPVYPQPAQMVQPAAQPAPVYQQPAFEQAQQPIYVNLQNTNPNLQPVAPVYQQPAAQPAPMVQPVIQPAPVYQQPAPQPAPMVQQAAMPQPVQAPMPAAQPDPIFAQPKQPAYTEPEKAKFDFDDFEEESQNDDSRFYTFTSKNKEFQQLLDEEYSKFYERYGEVPASNPKPERGMDDTKLFFPGLTPMEHQPSPAFRAPEPAFPQRGAVPELSEEELFNESEERLVSSTPVPAFPEAYASSPAYEEQETSPFRPADKRKLSREQLKIDIAQKHMQLAAREAEPDNSNKTSHQERLSQMARAREAYFEAMESLRATGEYTSEELDAVDIKKERKARKSEPETQPDEPSHAAQAAETHINIEENSPEEIALQVALHGEIKKSEAVAEAMLETQEPTPAANVMPEVQLVITSEPEAQETESEETAAEPKETVAESEETAAEPEEIVVESEPKAKPHINFVWDIQPEQVSVAETVELAPVEPQQQAAAEEQPTETAKTETEVEAGIEAEEAIFTEAAIEMPVPSENESEAPKTEELAAEQQVPEEAQPAVLTESRIVENEGEAAEILSQNLAALIEELEAEEQARQQAEEKAEEPQPQASEEQAVSKEVPAEQSESSPAEEITAAEQTDSSFDNTEESVAEAVEQPAPEVPAEEPAPKKKNYFDFMFEDEEPIAPSDSQASVGALVETQPEKAEEAQPESAEENIEEARAEFTEETQAESATELVKEAQAESAAEPEAKPAQENPKTIKFNWDTEAVTETEEAAQNSVPAESLSTEELIEKQTAEKVAQAAADAELADKTAEIDKLQGSLFSFEDIENLTFDDEPAAEAEVQTEQETEIEVQSEPVPDVEVQAQPETEVQAEIEAEVKAEPETGIPGEDLVQPEPESFQSPEPEKEIEAEEEPKAEKTSKKNKKDKDKSGKAAISDLKRTEKEAVKAARKELKSADRRYTKAAGHAEESRRPVRAFVITLVWVIILAFAIDAIFTTFFPDTVLAQFCAELNHAIYPVIENAYTGVRDFILQIFN